MQQTLFDNEFLICKTFIRTVVLQLIYLPPPWGDCKVTAMDSDFFDSYSITACRIDCETRYLVDNCNCRMVHMPGRERRREVNVSSLKALKGLMFCGSLAPGDAPYCTPELYKECADPALGKKKEKKKKRPHRFEHV